MRNCLFLRKIDMARQSRFQRARTAGERAVQCDLPDFEARSREAGRTGDCEPSRHSAHLFWAQGLETVNASHRWLAGC